jgi:dipeptidyl aminopeptidase/acylaminoacyl peptidase
MARRSLRFWLGAVAAGFCSYQASAASGDDASNPTRADYEAATKLLLPNVSGLVYNETLNPHWIGNSGRFWYRRDGEDGPEFVVVDPSGTKTPAFDHTAIATALYRALGQPARKGLPDDLKHVRLNDSLDELTANISSRKVSCAIKAATCSLAPIPEAGPAMAVSPDGRLGLVVRDDNLYLRDTATGAERALTTDGTARLSWATKPFYVSFLTYAQVRAGEKPPPWDASWSPDGRYIIAPLVDTREVEMYPVVEHVPVDGSKRPVVHSFPMPLPGDRGITKITYYIFDTQTGERKAIVLPDGFPELSWPGSWAPVQGWSKSRSQAFILARNDGWKTAILFRVDLKTAAVSKVIEENSPTRVEFNAFWGPANVRVIGDGSEIVWYSDRSGWAHLYLYDAQTGKLKNAITKGNWAIGDIQGIDEKRREIYVSGTGREPGQDLYFRNLYRASLDGRSPLVRLTTTDADHLFEAVRSAFLGTQGPTDEIGPSPLLRFSSNIFIDTWSTVDKPPVHELRSTRDGHLITVLERADASRLFAAGWVPPTRHKLKAADGTTDIYADYYAPIGSPAGTKVPVIANPYNGAASLRTPRNFTEAYIISASNGVSALARLGFAMVIADGRGTASRSRAFRDAGYPEFTQMGVDDNVAAIKQLGALHPEIDLDRAGVYGNSWGGTFAAQAILTHPDFFKVAIATAGGHDYTALEVGYDEYIGRPVYANGTQYRSGPADMPVNWNKVNLLRLAPNLKGKLLLTQGDLDEQAKPNQTYLLIDALTRANKPYDFIFIPNGSHSAFFTSYAMKRGWDYFIEHLKGAKPVVDFNIGLPGNLRAREPGGG